MIDTDHLKGITFVSLFVWFSMFYDALIIGHSSLRGDILFTVGIALYVVLALLWVIEAWS